MIEDEVAVPMARPRAVAMIELSIPSISLWLQVAIDDFSACFGLIRTMLLLQRLCCYCSERYS